MKNLFEVRGDVTSILIKHKGAVMETIIDTIELGKAQEIEGSWYADYSKNTNSFYVRSQYGGKKFRLHRWLLNNPQNKMVDHKNHDTLDNRRSSNLREATIFENSQNKKGAFKNSKSGIRGVTWDDRINKWCVQVQVNNKNKVIGYFEDLNEAEKIAKETRSKVMPYSYEESERRSKNESVV